MGAMDWWTGRPEERYWCEVTDREDIGADLLCPQTNETGGSFWGYELIREIQPGDLVFHYKNELIVGCSIAKGPLREEWTEWRAQGSFARARSVPAGPRRGWARPLGSYVSVRLSLTEIRKDELWMRELMDGIGSGSKKMPWLFQAGQLRGMQTYLAKLPAAFVARWDVLARVATELGAPPPADLADEPVIDRAQLTQLVSSRRSLRRAGRVLTPPRAADQPERVSTTTTVWARLPSVVEHVLARAAGRCEACGEPAPFLGDDDEPFLEVHHVRRLADGGPDRVENAVALCPNCHRALHHAKDRTSRLELLYERVGGLQRY